MYTNTLSCRRCGNLVVHSGVPMVNWEKDGERETVEQESSY